MAKMIVTVDRNWAIGNNNKPLVSIPDDYKFIKDATVGAVVIIGRHTFQSMFNGNVLPNRTMIIVTKDDSYNAPGILKVNSPEEALKKAGELDLPVYIIGGERLYENLLSETDEVFVTAVDYSYSADAYFPNLDKLPEWVMVDESDEQTHFDLVYYFKRYQRRKDYKTL